MTSDDIGGPGPSDIAFAAILAGRRIASMRDNGSFPSGDFSAAMTAIKEAADRLALEAFDPAVQTHLEEVLNIWANIVEYAPIRPKQFDDVSNFLHRYRGVPFATSPRSFLTLLKNVVFKRLASLAHKTGQFDPVQTRLDFGYLEDGLAFCHDVIEKHLHGTDRDFELTLNRAQRLLLRLWLDARPGALHKNLRTLLELALIDDWSILQSQEGQYSFEKMIAATVIGVTRRCDMYPSDSFSLKMQIWLAWAPDWMTIGTQSPTPPDEVEPGDWVDLMIRAETEDMARDVSGSGSEWSDSWKQYVLRLLGYGYGATVIERICARFLRSPIMPYHTLLPFEIAGAFEEHYEEVEAAHELGLFRHHLVVGTQTGDPDAIKELSVFLDPAEVQDVPPEFASAMLRGLAMPIIEGTISERAASVAVDIFLVVGSSVHLDTDLGAFGLFYRSTRRWLNRFFNPEWASRVRKVVDLWMAGCEEAARVGTASQSEKAMLHLALASSIAAREYCGHDLEFSLRRSEIAQAILRRPGTLTNTHLFKTAATELLRANATQALSMRGQDAGLTLLHRARTFMDESRFAFNEELAAVSSQIIVIAGGDPLVAVGRTEILRPAVESLMQRLSTTVQSGPLGERALLELLNPANAAWSGVEVEGMHGIVATLNARFYKPSVIRLDLSLGALAKKIDDHVRAGEDLHAISAFVTSKAVLQSDSFDAGPTSMYAWHFLAMHVLAIALKSDQSIPLPVVDLLAYEVGDTARRAGSVSVADHWLTDVWELASNIEAFAIPLNLLVMDVGSLKVGRACAVGDQDAANSWLVRMRQSPESRSRKGFVMFCASVTQYCDNFGWSNAEDLLRLALPNQMAELTTMGPEHRVTDIKLVGVLSRVIPHLDSLSDYIPLMRASFTRLVDSVPNLPVSAYIQQLALRFAVETSDYKSVRLYSRRLALYQNAHLASSSWLEWFTYIDFVGDALLLAAQLALELDDLIAAVEILELGRGDFLRMLTLVPQHSLNTADHDGAFPAKLSRADVFTYLEHRHRGTSSVVYQGDVGNIAALHISDFVRDAEGNSTLEADLLSSTFGLIDSQTLLNLSFKFPLMYPVQIAVNLYLLTAWMGELHLERGAGPEVADKTNIAHSATAIEAALGETLDWVNGVSSNWSSIYVVGAISTESDRALARRLASSKDDDGVRAAGEKLAFHVPTIRLVAREPVFTAPMDLSRRRRQVVHIGDSSNTLLGPWLELAALASDPAVELSALYGNNCSLIDLENAVSGAETVIMSCHGLIAGGRLLGAGVQLGSDFVTLDQVAYRRTFRNAQFVLLASCETGGQSPMSADRDSVSFMNALIASGCSTAAAPTQPINDIFGAVLVDEFRRQLATNVPSRAFGCARLVVGDLDAEGFADRAKAMWASFVMSEFVGEVEWSLAVMEQMFRRYLARAMRQRVWQRDWLVMSGAQLD